VINLVPVQCGCFQCSSNVRPCSWYFRLVFECLDYFTNLILFFLIPGISRDSAHKRRATGGKRKSLRKKRKFELGRPAANTKVKIIPGSPYKVVPIPSSSFSYSG